MQPLSHDSEKQLLSSLADDRKLPAAVSDQLLSYAEGNPFYMEQILRSLIDSGTLVPENGHWVLKAGALEIPRTLEPAVPSVRQFSARITDLVAAWEDATPDQRSRLASNILSEI